jgi:hypothetical protein
MATQIDFVCNYCDKQLSNIYKLERHKKTSKTCIKIQSLEHMPKQFDYDLIFRNFDIKRTSYTYICIFIKTYFITDKNYITTDKKRFIGKYIIDDQLQNDIGFEFILQIYKKIITYISTTSNTAFYLLQPDKSFSKSKLSKIPAIIKNHIAGNTYYKKGK